MKTVYIVAICKTGSRDEWIDYEGPDREEALESYRNLKHQNIDGGGYHVELREMCREYSAGDSDAYNYNLIED